MAGSGEGMMGGISRSGRNRLLTALAVVAVLAAVLSYVPAAPWSRRAPDPQELTLYYFAQQLAAPALCRGISWDAYQSQAGVPGGASRLRSDCYERVAEAAGDDSLCWQVRPLVDLNPLSSGNSALACSRRTDRGYRSDVTLSDAALAAAFHAMGYDLDDMHLQGVVQPPVRMADVYQQLVTDTAAMGRARDLLAHGAPGLQADDRSYLADLTAIGSGDSQWCAYIPADRISAHEQAPLRDWCYFTVAYNTRDPRVCTRLPPADKEARVIAAEAAGAQPGTAEQMSLRRQCERVGAYTAGRQLLRYAAEIPPAGGQLQRLFDALGVAVPRADAWPVAQQAAYLHGVLAVLGARKPPDAVRDAARAALVQKLLASQ